MCGFVSLVRREHLSAQEATRAVAAAAQAIAHRGPDDAGIETRANICFAFRRLAILDLSPSGHQPMISPDDRYTMVFNGEIYNYLELREELRTLGHSFRSSGDSEVLLRAFMEWGTDAFRKLRGMFAVCIHDARDNSVVAARDRFGIKPLYIFDGEHGLLLASELKCVRASGLWKGSCDDQQFATILSYGRSDTTPESSRTVLTGVRQLPPAHFIRVTADGASATHSYWDPSAVRRGTTAHVDQFRQVFDEAVRLHLRADVPVGVMLSGGMDSTAITCTMAEMVRQERGALDLHAFSYQSAKFDEVEQIADTLRATNAIQHVLGDADAMSIWSGLRDVIWYHDEPVHSPTVLVGFQLYALAADTGIRVVLNGQGADETLAGYPFFAEHVLLERSQELDGADRRLEFASAAEMLGTDVEALERRVASLKRAGRRSALPLYTTLTAGRRMRDAGSHRFLSPEFAALAKPIPSRFRGEGFSAAILRAISQGPLPQYLRVEDRNSMAHSIESRVPFLDHVLVEHALALPAASLMSAGWNKRILRDAMRGRIPNSVCDRRAKLGFPTAARDWFAGPLSPSLRDLIAGSAAQRSGWFEMPTVRQALEDHVSGRVDNTGILFSFAQANAWLELHQTNWKR